VLSASARRGPKPPPLQLEYAQLWRSTYNVVSVRKAIVDPVQAVISGKKQADEAVRDAQKNADEILRPYNEKIAHVSAF